MSLFKVYDEKGEMFEVAPHIAQYLIVDLGWTTLPPEKATPVFKEPEPAPAPAAAPEPAPAPAE